MLRKCALTLFVLLVFASVSYGAKRYFDARCQTIDFDRAVVTSEGLACEWQGFLYRAMP